MKRNLYGNNNDTEAEYLPAISEQNNWRESRKGEVQYSIEIGKEICERIAKGELLRQIAMLPHMPDDSSMRRWVLEREDFRAIYKQAKEEQMDYYAEEIIDIADNGTNDWQERENQRTGEKYWALKEEVFARSRLRIDTRKWVMGKLAPKKYGDYSHLQIEGKLTLAALVESSFPNDRKIFHEETINKSRLNDEQYKQQIVDPLRELVRKD